MIQIHDLKFHLSTWGLQPRAEEDYEGLEKWKADLTFSNQGMHMNDSKICMKSLTVALDIVMHKRRKTQRSQGVTSCTTK